MGNLGSLAEHDQFLIRNAEIGYRRAAELLSWYQARLAGGGFQILTLRPPGEPELNYFYDSLTLNGSPISAMGCVWKPQYRRQKTSEPVSDATLPAFIQKRFLRRCLWTNPDGLPGGFNFIPLQYKLRNRDEYGVFPKEGFSLDLAEIGQKYEWVVMEAVVNDFFRYAPGPRLGPRMLARMPRMASYVLVHNDYFSSFHPPIEGTAGEICFGYSFLPCAVSKSVFGYGPGMFKAAVKQFRFVLLQSGDIEIQMFFLVAPRSEKILNFGGFDPVYTTVNLINLLTLNLLGIKRRAHDKLDSIQLAVHAKIYQSLLDGLKDVWENQDWIEAVRSADAAMLKARETSER